MRVAIAGVLAGFALGFGLAGFWFLNPHIALFIFACGLVYVVVISTSLKGSQDGARG